MSAGPVEHWARQLRERVGVDEHEVSARCADLLAFCRARGVSAVDLLDRWEDFPELLVRRRPGTPGGTSAAAHLSVESYLIHNGVNVFGEITCVAGRPADLALQGPQFLPGGRASSPTPPPAPHPLAQLLIVRSIACPQRGRRPARTAILRMISARGLGEYGAGAQGPRPSTAA